MYTSTGFIIAVSVLVVVTAEVSDANKSGPSTVATTTPSVEDVCASLNESCGTCLSNAKCLWCPSKSPGCFAYPSRSVFPPSSLCAMSDFRWGTCWVNFEALVIALGVIAGILIISLTICICCCCRRCQRRGITRRERREEALNNAEFEERRSRHAARRAERQVKYDEIRRKYGLSPDGASSSTPYSRFDNEA